MKERLAKAWEASPAGRVLTKLTGRTHLVAKEVGTELRQASAKAQLMVKNAIEGRIRERMVDADLRKSFPNAVVQNQSTIVDQSGKKVVDPITEQGRRLDHVVIEDGVVRKIVETTSQSARKVEQLNKEDRIRYNGGEYVIDRTTGKAISIEGVETEVARVDISKSQIEYGEK